MERVAVIDIGTNTFHLIIGGGSEPIYKHQIAVKLAEGMTGGQISPAAIERAENALLELAETIRQNNISQVKAVATSALRKAVNGEEIKNRLSEKCGINIEIIDGEKEAEYIFQGVGLHWPAGENNALIMDIGGGSVEFMVGKRGNLHWKSSFEIGAGRLLNEFRPSDPIQPNEIATIRESLNATLQPLWEALLIHQPVEFIGSAGSFMSLAAMAGLSDSDDEDEIPDSAEFLIARERFDLIYNRIISSTLRQRLAIKGLAGYRAEMMVMAMLLIKLVLDKTGFSQIHISPNALKEGVLAALLL